ncbi:MAG: hypothetical protein MUF84_04375 [Anaerolineae bacterium]|jgi:hypothetical protein|nr:hypothetical protein [Anaerolineae bacterium]
MDSSPCADILARLQAIKARYESDLLAKANVVAVGIGIPIRDGKPRGGPAIIVSVTHKVQASELRPEDLIPQTLEDVRIWVEEIGPLSARS